MMPGQGLIVSMQGLCITWLLTAGILSRTNLPAVAILPASTASVNASGRGCFWQLASVYTASFPLMLALRIQHECTRYTGRDIYLLTMFTRQMLAVELNLSHSQQACLSNPLFLYIELNSIECLDWDLAQIHQTILLLLLFGFQLSALHSVRKSAIRCVDLCSRNTLRS